MPLERMNMMDLPLEDQDGPPKGPLNVIPPVVPPIDMVNQPPHYTGGKVECIDAIEVATEGLEGIEAYCTAAALKYLWRWKKKNGAEDLQKCRWYINRMLERL
jgi:hypothetical protein